MNISGKTVLVTGGGSGLGEATVRMVAEAGGCAVIADVNEEGGQAVAKDLKDQVRFVRTDVTSEESVAAAIDVATNTFGGLHGVVNCAGVAAAMRTISKIGPHPLELFEHVIRINLIGTFNVIRLAATAMAKGEPMDSGERGVIICTASVAAFEGQVGQAAYSASKAGIVGMTLPIARDLAQTGIRVLTIAPGLFDTPMLGMLPEKARESLAAQVPFPSRLGRPSEFAALCRHIFENGMLNAETIRLDGAIRMAPR